MTQQTDPTAPIVPDIVHTPPPNWDELVTRYGAKWGRTVVTYGNRIHCSRPPSNDVFLHECVHIVQQTGGILTPEQWWERYHDDPLFRLAQELEAYRAQANFLIKNIKDRNALCREIDRIARDLATSYQLGIGFTKARELILEKPVKGAKENE